MKTLLLAWIACAPVIAHAQPAAAAAQAEALFRQGRELMEANRLAEACAAFEASQRLDPTIGTLLNHANCREKNDQLATAWGLFLEAARTTRNAIDDTGRGHHLVAMERAQKLEPRVSKLTISVTAESHVENLVLARDGQRLDQGMWNRALPIDGGTYTITASAPGSMEWSAKITIGVERDTKSVDVPKLATLVVASPAEPVRPRSQKWSIAIGAGSLAVLGGALALELSARATYDNTDPAREPDPIEQDRLWRSANGQRHVAQGLAVVGVAGAGVAVWMYLRQRRVEQRPASARRLRPVIAPAHVGIVGRF